MLDLKGACDLRDTVLSDNFRMPPSCLAGETLTNAGLADANPNKAVPAIDDNGFTMFERFT